jgi:tRNA(Arg) A34 adenosine deaminase TadA
MAVSAKGDANMDAFPHAAIKEAERCLMEGDIPIGSVLVLSR